jgi:hypothetical protein
MRAFHVMWSRPILDSKMRGLNNVKMTRYSNPHTFFRDYEILLLILSILKWKQKNGVIKLYADKLSAQQFRSNNLFDLWSESDTDLLENIDPNLINASFFWSTGRFYAYLNEPAPVVSLDMDMIVWADLTQLYQNFDLRFTHWEITKHSQWYPYRRELKRPVGYHFKQSWNWKETMAANTSIVYFGNDTLKNYYATEALNFIKNNSLTDSPSFIVTPEILFAEQRLLGMIARETDANIKPFLDAVWDPRKSDFVTHDKEYGRWFFDYIEPQPMFTHTWVAKDEYNERIDKRTQYCRRLVRAILREFPDQLDRLKSIEKLQTYLPK